MKRAHICFVNMLVLSLTFQYGLAQNDTTKGQYLHKLGFGMNPAGYRLNNPGIYTEYYFSHISLSGELIMNKYYGLGYSLGVNYTAFFQKYKIIPCGGLTYTRMLGGGYSVETSPDHIAGFSVNACSFLIPFAGIKYNLFSYIGDDKLKRNNEVSIFLRVGYRFAMGGKPGATQISGDPYPQRLEVIKNSINEGIGAGLGFVVFIGNKERK